MYKPEDFFNTDVSRHDFFKEDDAAKVSKYTPCADIARIMNEKVFPLLELLDEIDEKLCPHDCDKCKNESNCKHREWRLRKKGLVG